MNRHAFYLVFAVATGIALASCEGGKDEQHYTAVEKQYVETFADQSKDSLRVLSYDTWSLTNQTDWLTVYCGTQKNEITQKVPANTQVLTTVYFALQPNTTGKTRYAQVQVNSSYGGTVSSQLMQYAFLNVQRPAPVTDSSTRVTTFTYDIVAKPVASASVVFTVYADGATLTSSDESWLKPEKTTGFSTGEKTTVSVAVSENTASEARTATLTLTSAGVSTPITFNQKGTGL